MSKSRYSKTKSAGALSGMTRYRKEFKSRAGTCAGLEQVENRQMRRLKGKS